MFNRALDLDPRDKLPSLNILDSELEEFKRTGRKHHLLHAARALDDARSELKDLLTLELQTSRQGESHNGCPHERQ